MSVTSGEHIRAGGASLSPMLLVLVVWWEAAWEPLQTLNYSVAHLCWLPSSILEHKCDGGG